MLDYLFWLIGFGKKTSENDRREEDEIVKDYVTRTKQQQKSQELLGKITQVCDTSCEIDNKFLFAITTDLYKIGDVVRYKINDKGFEVDISDVSLVETSVDTTARSTSYFSGYVKSVDGKVVTVTPGDLKFDCNRVDIDFVPCPGDYINLSGNFPDTGDDYIVERVTPTESKMVSALITSYDLERQCGNIGSVYFHKDNCEDFLPGVKASVFCNAIRSRQENFEWRATKVIFLHKRMKTDIEISRIPFFLLELGEKKVIDIEVCNCSNKVTHIGNIEMTASDPDLKFINLPEADILAPGCSIVYSLLCIGKSLGKTTANLKWTFGKFIVRRTLKYDTIKTKVIKIDGRSNKFIVPSKNKFTLPNYVNVKLKMYAIPTQLDKSNIDSEHTYRKETNAEILNIFPVLKNGLSKVTYNEIMHALLFLEEYRHLQQVRTLSKSFCLYQRQDLVYLSFEAESPYANFIPGDSVLVSKPWEYDIQYQGKIWEVTPTQMFVKFHPQFMYDYREGALYNIEFLFNRTPMRKRHFAIDIVVKNNLLNRVFPPDLLQDNNEIERPVEFWFNEDLNKEQQSAVNSILSQSDKTYPYVICGPPGTGKTVTLVELILQLCKIEDTKIIISAPTNSAIDQISVKLLEAGVNKSDMIRLCSYNSRKTGSVPDCIIDISFVPSLFEELPCFFSDPVPVCTKNNIGLHKITLSTTNCIGTLCAIGLPQGFFTHIIIDEAGQCNEPETMIPVTFLDKTKAQLILAGDPYQLGPVTISKYAEEYGLGKSFLQRLTESAPYIKNKSVFPDFNGYDKRIITKLVKNYRALPRLVKMTSKLFYDNELIPVISDIDSREALLLKGICLSGRNLGEDMLSVLFINVDGKEEQIEDNWSWFNMAEIAQIIIIINQLYQTLTPSQIGIITPYNLQSKKIKSALDELKLFSPRVGSVEEFQGAEKDVIIYSLVRNCPQWQRMPDFINNRNKVNVALSRAKVLNIIVGSRQFVSHDALWKNILTFCN